MTKYEMLQTLLNTLILHDLILKQVDCDKVNTILSECEDGSYLLDVQIIEIFYDQELVMYTETFVFTLDYRGSVSSFMIKFDELVSPSSALESAELGKKIEDFLKSRLN